MYNFKKFFLILFFNLISFNHAYSGENIVFIDIDYVLNNSNLGKIIYKDLEEINNKNIELLNSKEKIIKEKKKQLIKLKILLLRNRFKKILNYLMKKLKSIKKKRMN